MTVLGFEPRLLEPQSRVLTTIRHRLQSKAHHSFSHLYTLAHICALTLIIKSLIHINNLFFFTKQQCLQFKQQNPPIIQSIKHPAVWRSKNSTCRSVRGSNQPRYRRGIRRPGMCRATCKPQLTILRSTTNRKYSSKAK